MPRLLRRIAIETATVGDAAGARPGELLHYRWDFRGVVQRGEDVLDGFGVKLRPSGEVHPAQGTADRRPKSERVPHRAINRFRVRHAGFEQAERFTVHGVTDAISDEAGNFLLQKARLFAESPSQGKRRLNRCLGSLFAANDFQEACRMRAAWSGPPA